MFVVALRRESSGRAAACGAGGERRAQWAQIAAARGRRALATASQRPSALSLTAYPAHGALA